MPDPTSANFAARRRRRGLHAGGDAGGDRDHPAGAGDRAAGVHGDHRQPQQGGGAEHRRRQPGPRPHRGHPPRHAVRRLLLRRPRHRTRAPWPSAPSTRWATRTPYDEYKSFSRGGGTGFSGYQGGTLDPLDGNNGTDNVEDEPPMTGRPRRGADRRRQNAIRYGGNYAAFFGRPLVAVLQHTSGDTDGNPDNGNQNPGVNDPRRHDRSRPQRRANAAGLHQRRGQLLRRGLGQQPLLGRQRPAPAASRSSRASSPCCFRPASACR